LSQPNASILPESEVESESKIRLRLWLRLLKTSRSIEAVIRENLRTEFATTLPRFDVMSALSRYDKGLKMSALSGVLKVSNGNVTGIVDRLVQDGLAIRVPVAGDRRAHRARLTQKGRDDFAVQAAAHEDWINDLLSGFDVDTAAALCAHLDTAAPSNDET
jgi:DNA-binding MarR family transcriptional regulator